MEIHLSKVVIQTCKICMCAITSSVLYDSKIRQIVFFWSFFPNKNFFVVVFVGYIIQVSIGVMSYCAKLKISLFPITL